MDALTAAWTAAGRPRPGLACRDGRCARCGQAGPVVTLRAVISRVFTAYDGWTDPTGTGLCACCAWGYRHRPLRAGAHLVTRAGSSRALTVSQVGRHLQQALPPDRALIVPLHPGRKHLVPTAVWGRVTVEDAHLSWTGPDTHRLAAVRRLRAHGFGTRMLTAPAPPWAVLRRLSPADYASVLDDWRDLDPWRERRPWLALALHATLTDHVPGQASTGPRPLPLMSGVPAAAPIATPAVPFQS